MRPACRGRRGRPVPPLLPALLLTAAAVLTRLFASGAYKFLGLVLGCFALLALLLGAAKLCGPPRDRWLRRTAAALTILGLVSFGAGEAVVIAGAHSEIAGSPDVMIVLGAQVKPWGPSVLLKDRLDTALAYLADHPDMTVVVSGGKGDDEHLSEAQCMYDYLTAHGADGDRILREDQSRNTWQNFRNSLRLLRERGDAPEAGEVLVVSSGFHLARARMLFRRVWGGTEGPSTLAAPSTDLPARLNSYAREVPALLKSWALDR